MKPSTKDAINGNIHEVKSTVKETAGNVTNNPDLEAKGKAEHSLGKVERKIGQMEKVLEK
ncbi:MAG: CsbD family protein [Terriglobia bacterium]|nr:CsbD family protein [Terriglobia bacterium]